MIMLNKTTIIFIFWLRLFEKALSMVSILWFLACIAYWVFGYMYMYNCTMIVSSFYFHIILYIDVQLIKGINNLQNLGINSKNIVKKFTYISYILFPNFKFNAIYFPELWLNFQLTKKIVKGDYIVHKWLTVMDMASIVLCIKCWNV